MAPVYYESKRDDCAAGSARLNGRVCTKPEDAHIQNVDFETFTHGNSASELLRLKSPGRNSHYVCWIKLHTFWINHMATLQELIAQKEALEKLIQDQRQTELSDAIGKVQQLITQYGLTQEDIFGASRAPKKTKAEGSKVAAKYRDPVSGKEWSGRGLAPKWLQGRDKSQFLI
jgi:DNA-binding protein H-NS